jgi:hypothetical protein
VVHFIKIQVAGKIAGAAVKCMKSANLFGFGRLTYIVSAGQPCCVVRWEIDIPALELVTNMRKSIFNSTTKGGYDKLFTFTGSDPQAQSVTEQFAPGDCSSSSINGPLSDGTTPCYLVKGFHTPSGQRMQKFVDEISFAVYVKSPTSCSVKAMSRTKLVTVNCDGGRNYLNLQNSILHLGVLSYVESTLYGCTQKR